MTTAELMDGSQNEQTEKQNGVKSNLYVERKQFPAKIRMKNGLIFRGNVHFRPTINRVKDELNEYSEKFIALTEITDQKSRKITYPALIAFQQIAYIAVDDSALVEQQMINGTNRPDDSGLQKRKISAHIAFPDGTRIRCSIFVRSFLKRAKDELNIRNEGKFIVVEDVVEPNAAEDDARLTYFINTDQVVCIIPMNDQVD